VSCSASSWRRQRVHPVSPTSGDEVALSKLRLRAMIRDLKEKSTRICGRGPVGCHGGSINLG
jgi:hypothetical protein